MPLDKSKLTEALGKLMDPSAAGFVGFPADSASAAANFADAYAAYAADAVDVSGDRLTVANKPGFQAALGAGLASSTSAAQAAQAFANAWLAFWTGATFAVGALPSPAARCPSIGGTGIFSVEVTSLVTVAVPAPLQAALLTEFATLSAVGTIKAAALADAWHTATTTNILVLITGLDVTPPPAGPLPITNTCTIS